MTEPIKGDETPSPEQVIATAIEARLVDLHILLPGEFVSYDSATQKAKVKISLKRKYKDGTLVDMPTLMTVPVYFPRTAKSIIHLPIKPGDKCEVRFSERSLDKWKKFGAGQDPGDPRKFHLSDAIASPGLYPFTEGYSIEKPNALSLINDKGIIEIFEDGKFLFRKQGGDEILDLLISITAQLEEMANQLGTVSTTNTIFGAMKLNNFQAFVNLKAAVLQLKNKLTAMKGA